MMGPLSGNHQAGFGVVRLAEEYTNQPTMIVD
jgi:hypothetical protein